MEVNERRIKDASISLLTIGWRSSQSLASALRQAIFRIQYVNTLYGERSCHDYLKSTQGRRFKDEGTFASLVSLWCGGSGAVPAGSFRGMGR